MVLMTANYRGFYPVKILCLLNNSNQLPLLKKLALCKKNGMYSTLK